MFDKITPSLEAVLDYSGECKTRQKSARKRRLHGVNEHFEPIFNAVLCQLRDFKTAS
jgi:hypothetical protein